MSKESRENAITLFVEQTIPDFAGAIKKCKEIQKDPRLLMHQDAFASGYDLPELLLIGYATKYAGLHGVTLMFHGTNGETLNLPSRQKSEE